MKKVYGGARTVGDLTFDLCKCERDDCFLMEWNEIREKFLEDETII